MATIGGSGPALLIVFFAIGFAIVTLLFLSFWNITMPDVFGLRRITFWQAFRLLLLAGIVFGGLGLAANFHQSSSSVITSATSTSGP